MSKDKDIAFIEYKLERMTKRELLIYLRFKQFLIDNMPFPILKLYSSLYSEIVKKKINKDKQNVTERYIVGSIIFETNNNNNYDIIFGIDTDTEILQYTLWKNDKCVLSTTDYNKMDDFSKAVHSEMKKFNVL